MKRLMLVLLMSLSSVARSDFKDWDPVDKNIFITYSAIAVVDVLQTRSALSDPCECYAEANPLFGRYPSTGTIAVANAATAYLIYRAIDSPEWSPRYRPALRALTAVRFGVIVNNHHLGVRIQLNF